MASKNTTCTACASSALKPALRSIQSSLGVSKRTGRAAIFLVALVILTLFACVIFSLVILFDSSTDDFDCGAGFTLTTAGLSLVLGSVLVWILVKRVWNLPETLDLDKAAHAFNKELDDCVEMTKSLDV